MPNIEPALSGVMPQKNMDGRLYRRRRKALPGKVSLTAGIIIGAVLIGGTILAYLVGLTSSIPSDVSNRLLPMGSPSHLFGTDGLGRDLFRWTVAGFGWTAAVSTLGTCIAALIAIIIGGLAGSTKGIVATAAARTIDVTLSVPYLVIAVAIMTAIGRGYWPLSITLGIVSWPIFARVIYAETRGLTERDYVKAARLIGVSWLRIQFSHILPGLRHTIMVMWAFVFADLLVAESGLSFLGIGAPLGAPSLGNMLSSGRQYLVQSPGMVIVPAAVIVLAVSAANLIGDGLAARSRGLTRTVQR